jgi:hypothetical protein
MLSLVTALIAGLTAGFLLSIPVGPINVTILDEAAKRGFANAAMAGLGAMIMDIIYCSIAFAGFSGLFMAKEIRATMELLSFLLLIYLGFKYLLTHSIAVTTPTLEKVEEKLHPHTSFWVCAGSGQPGGAPALGDRFGKLPGPWLDLKRHSEQVGLRAGNLYRGVELVHCSGFCCFPRT